MTNKNYQKGRRFEYEIKKHFESLGYCVLRSSGSHGPFDLVAIKDTQVLFIQCKVVSTDAQAGRLRSEWLSNPPYKPYGFPASQVLAVKLAGNGVVFQHV